MVFFKSVFLKHCTNQNSIKLVVPQIVPRVILPVHSRNTTINVARLLLVSNVTIVVKYIRMKNSLKLRLWYN